MQCISNKMIVLFSLVQADEQELAEKKKKRTFRKYTYRGVDLDQLLDMSRLVMFCLKN